VDSQVNVPAGGNRVQALALSLRRAESFAVSNFAVSNFAVSKERPLQPRIDPRKRYQEKALGCLLGVHDMHDPAARATMLQIARAWMRLANSFGERTDDGSPGEAGHLAPGD